MEKIWRDSQALGESPSFVVASVKGNKQKNALEEVRWKSATVQDAIFPQNPSSLSPKQ